MSNRKSAITEIDSDAIDKFLKNLGDRKKPTINDVAHFSHVSKKTVSRVINGSTMVRENTRDQVNAVIDQIGFVPDPQARGLAFRHSFLIGLIYDNPNPQYVVNIQEGILEALSGTEFELAVHKCSRTDPKLIQEALRFVERQKLYGVVLTPSISEHDDLADALRETDCKFIRIASVKLDEQKHMLTSNDVTGGLAAANYLVELGHTKIAYISGAPDFRSSSERREGFEAGLAEANLQLQSKYVVEGAYTFDSGYRAAERLLSLKDRPTAIFAANDEMAVGAMQAVRVRGLKVPDDISIVGYDDLNLAPAVWPKLTTIHSPVKEIGRLAAAKLMSFRNDTTAEAVDETEPWLVIRDSAAPPK